LVAAVVCLTLTGDGYSQESAPANQDVRLVVQTGHRVGLRAVAFTPNGRHVVTGAGDQTARLWDAPTGKELLAFIGHSRFLTTLAISRDGNRLLTGSADRTARLWNI